MNVIECADSLGISLFWQRWVEWLLYNEITPFNFFRCFAVRRSRVKTVCFYVHCKCYCWLTLLRFCFLGIRYFKFTSYAVPNIETRMALVTRSKIFELHAINTNYLNVHVLPHRCLLKGQQWYYDATLLTNWSLRSSSTVKSIYQKPRSFNCLYGTFLPFNT